MPASMTVNRYTLLRIRSRASSLLLDRNTLFIQGCKTALAASLCYALSRMLFGFPEGYWSSISAIVVLQSNVGSTLTASRDRFIGTTIGALLGFIASAFWPGILAYAVTILATMIVCSALGLKNSSRLGAITVTIVMLVNRPGSHWVIARDRFLEVLLGIVTAIAVSVFVLPRRAREHLREGLTQEYALLGRYFTAIYKSFGDEPVEDLADQRTASEAVVLSNEQLLLAARNEPASGPATIEALSLLNEFGQALFHSLIALESVMRDAREDTFMRQLEPELGVLAQHITRSFQFDALCIHTWRFPSAPPDLNLPEDLLALEERARQVRSTTRSFELEEMMRAYAFQLHLREIARMVRQARLEMQQASNHMNS